MMMIQGEMEVVILGAVEEVEVGLKVTVGYSNLEVGEEAKCYCLRVIDSQAAGCYSLTNRDLGLHFWAAGSD
jgi:hypothetical protein